jgi:hypothetical protein
VVLARAVILLGLVGCSKSLFDNGGGKNGDDNAVTCPDPCVANAAGDFDGTPAPAHWRFLDDHRDRTWAEMTASGGGLAGADPMNAVATCAAHPDAAACATLPGALLVSSSGSTSAADPAVEFTASSNQVLALAVHAFVADGPDQVIRLYRNSREDVLATATATAGTTLDQTITIDALAGDRILVAVAPTGAGATDVGLHFFVSDAGMAFPTSCQLAVSFDSASGTTVTNACGMSWVNNDYNAGTMIPATLGAGPFPEQHQAAQIAMNTYYTGGDLLDKSGDVTIQMWVKLDMLDGLGDAGFAFSDYDLDNAGGVALVFYDMSGTQMEVSTCTSPNPLDFTGDHVAYAADGTWHFARIVHTNGTVSTCLDGTRVMRFPLATGKLASTYKPYLGKDVIWTPAGAFFAGALDDVRVFKGALACE